MKAYFEYPKYNCQNCCELYSDQDHVPDCLRSGRECLIGEDIALNKYIRRFTQSFILYHRIPRADHHKNYCDELLEHFELTDDSDFLMQLETAYLNFDYEARSRARLEDG